MSNYQNYINNEFVEPAEFHDVLNPSTGQVIAQAPASDAAAVDDAVQAAKAAQADWAKLPAVERAGYLTKIAAELRNHVDRFADYLVREQGKARGLATVEVNFTADYLDYMAGFARRIEGEVILRSPKRIHFPDLPTHWCCRWHPAVELPVLPHRAQNGSGPAHRQHHRHQAFGRNPDQRFRVRQTGRRHRPAQGRVQHGRRPRLRGWRCANPPQGCRHDLDDGFGGYR